MLSQPIGAPPTGPVSPLLTDRVVIQHDLRVPMRDGVELALDLLRPDLSPDERDTPRPVVLIRTPYDKTRQRIASRMIYEDLARRGYIVAVNDCRGRFNSGGHFIPYLHEHDDGYDTIEWIAAQPWCDGNVGMLGGSYAGQVQWQAAARQPPHLKAIVPVCSPPASLWRNEPIYNGMLMLGFGEWMVFMGRRTFQTDDTDLLTSAPAYLSARPVAALAEHAGVSSDWWQTFLDHPNYDRFWAAGGYDTYEQMTVPALSVTGWWDLNFPGAPQNFTAMTTRAATQSARAGQKLVIGPWPHRVNTTQTLSGVDFGLEAVIDPDNYVLRFFDRWLRDAENGLDDEPAVYAFMLGENRWRRDDAFPPRSTSETTLYLRSNGNANTLLGDGLLSTAAPVTDEPDDVYVYDPADVPQRPWSIAEGPVDDRTATAHEDVLCYTTRPLTGPVTVLGWIRVQLWAASSARDTDWHARLVDVHPDGTARFLCRGALRARFRDSFEMSRLLEPDVAEVFKFDLDATGIRFASGHRIRLEISSSWFPQYDRNPNTGSDNPFREAGTVRARQRVLHRPGAQSRLILPIQPS